MLIHVLGPSGSGKSTAARVVMAALLKERHSQSIYLPPNQRELGKIYASSGTRPVVVLGRYDSTCGGLDVLKRDYVTINTLVSYYLGENYDVLSEGHLTQKQTWWLNDLHQLYGGVYVLCINCTAEEATMGIASRRARTPDDIRPGSVGYFEYQVRSNERVMGELGKLGIRTEWTTRQECPKRLLELFGVKV